MPGQPLSLLWPGSRATAEIGRLDEQAIADLHLDEIVRAIVGGGAPAGRLAARERFAHEVLTTLVRDTEIIAYRQAVLADLLDNASLREQLEQVLPALEALGDVPRGERYRPTAEPGLERVARRLADLELLIDVVSRLSDALDQAPLTSHGLRALAVQLQDQRHAPEFAALERELPALRCSGAKAVRWVVPTSSCVTCATCSARWLRPSRLPWSASTASQPAPWLSSAASWRCCSAWRAWSSSFAVQAYRCVGRTVRRWTIEVRSSRMRTTSAWRLADRSTPGVLSPTPSASTSAAAESGSSPDQIEGARPPTRARLAWPRCSSRPG